MVKANDDNIRTEFLNECENYTWKLWDEWSVQQKSTHTRTHTNTHLVFDVFGLGRIWCELWMKIVWFILTIFYLTLYIRLMIVHRSALIIGNFVFSLFSSNELMIENRWWSTREQKMYGTWIYMYYVQKFRWSFYCQFDFFCLFGLLLVHFH